MKHNFGAGPCILPQEVFQEAAQAVLNFNDTGLSILEISHRSKEFEAVMTETEQLVRELLSVPQGYAVIFLQGGARTQFPLVPMNLLPEGGKAAYLDTGTWASKAIKEAKKLGEVAVVVSSAHANCNCVPKTCDVPVDAAYLHYVSNHTIFATEVFAAPKSSVPVVSHVSSDIL